MHRNSSWLSQRRDTIQESNIHTNAVVASHAPLGWDITATIIVTDAVAAAENEG